MTRTSEAASSTQAAPIANDPYEQYLAEQEETECQWDVNRAAKRAKLHAEEVASDVATLRQQLEAKTNECHQLRSKLEKTEKRQMRAQENLYEVCTFTICFLGSALLTLTLINMVVRLNNQALLTVQQTTFDLAVYSFC